MVGSCHGLVEIWLLDVLGCDWGKQQNNSNK